MGGSQALRDEVAALKRRVARWEECHRVITPKAARKKVHKFMTVKQLNRFEAGVYEPGYFDQFEFVDSSEE